MKHNLLFIVLIFLTLVACEKNPTTTRSGNLVLTGISSAKGNEMVTIDLDSGYVNANPVSCYILSSTIYDPDTGGYGYVSCDTVFTLVNTGDGSIIRSIRLPGLISSAVIDPENNVLIGTYGEYEYVLDPDSTNGATLPVFHTYLLTTDMETGDIVLNKEFSLGDGVYLCTHFFDPVNRLYILQRADKSLLYINPVTGSLTKTVELAEPLTNMVYNTDENNIIAMRPGSEEGEYYIDVYNPSTGELISSSPVNGIDGYHYCIAAYDPVTKCYLAVSSDNEVLFILPVTGEIVKTVKLDYPLSDIRFLRK